MALQEYALLVAGGAGKRFQGTVPKQFVEVAGKPVLLHTLAAFHAYAPQLQVILVLPACHMDLWGNLCEKYHFKHPVILQAGGETRSASVQQGMKHLPLEGRVAVHDGVRPLVPRALIHASFAAAEKTGAAVPVIPCKDALRVLVGEGVASRSVARDNYRMVQTPQTFSIAILRDAYERMGTHAYADDASLVEAAGYPVQLIEGSYRNIKITTPEDLALMRCLLTQAEAQH